METTSLIHKFELIGARLKVNQEARRYRESSRGFSLDIQKDRKGEFFQITPHGLELPEFVVLDVKPKDRHLLLLSRDDRAKDKYLCGHDERHWFVAGIPETASVGTVTQAKDALKPRLVKQREASVAISAKSRYTRKNSAFVRQGEWFFIPADNLVVNELLVLKNEPLRRSSGGKPHWAEFCYRTGGELVYVCSKNGYRNGVSEHQYKKLLSGNPEAVNWGWFNMRRNPIVYVHGRIRHADHNAIALHGWHQVVMNTENQSRAMRNVAFLD